MILARSRYHHRFVVPLLLFVASSFAVVVVAATTGAESLDEETHRGDGSLDVLGAHLAKEAANTAAAVDVGADEEETLDESPAVVEHTSRQLLAPVVMTFEGVNEDLVGNFYNGAGGPNYGVVFSSTAVGAMDSDAGGNADIANEPSPDTTLFFFDFGGFTVQTGFTSLSFYYTSDFGGSVSVYDGPEGGGKSLADVMLPDTGYCDSTGPGACGDPTGSYGKWELFTVPFTGVAKSVVFGYDLFTTTFYDNITMTIVPCAKTTYWLWNPSTNKAVRELKNNTSTCIPDPYNIEVRPCADPKVRPARVWLRKIPKGKKGGGVDIIQARDEYRPPYLLWGGDKLSGTGDVYPNDKPLRAGTYELRSKMDGKIEKFMFTQTC